MLILEDKGLKVKTKFFLSFIAKAMGREKTEVIGCQCFVCKHEDIFLNNFYINLKHKISFV